MAEEREERKAEQKKYKHDIKKEKKEKERVEKHQEPEEEPREQHQPNIKLSSEASLFKTVEGAKKEDSSREVLTLDHGITEEDIEYEFPPISFLSEGKVSNKNGKKTYEDIATKLRKTLYNFGVSAQVENVSVGPTITRYELKPAEGVRVSKIENLADDIALNLAAETIRIEAPIPGTQFVGIEIPNKEKEIVALRDIIETEKFYDAESKLTFALRKRSSRRRAYNRHIKDATRFNCR